MGTHRSQTAGRAALPALAATLALVLGGSALLTGCPTVDLGDTPSDIGLCNPSRGLDYFTNQIWPNYIQPTNTTRGCTKSGGCHNEAGGNALNFRTQPQDDAFNYRQTQIYLNCGQPDMSPMLTRPEAGIDAHGGGDLIPTGDPSIDIFLGWFAE
ncbi:hypothetical protein BH11MYX2_BH11MYX2_36300 [soil metagenome]